MNDFLQKVYWNNTIEKYLWVLGGIAVCWIVIKIIKGPLIKLFKKISGRTKSNYDDAIISGVEKFLLPYIFLIAIYSLLNMLQMHPKVGRGVNILMAVLSTYFIIRLINHILHKSVVFYMEMKGEPRHRIIQITGILLIFKGIIWIVGILVLVENLGYNVTSVVAGLGVGGIAVALAAQNILGDLFSYFVIFFDKPFEVGDSININGRSGTVEKIGIKTTLVRSLSGEQLVVPNADLVKSPIQNFKRQEERRIALKINVSRLTDENFLKQFPKELEKIVSSKKNTRFDRAHLSAITNVSLEFELIYFVIIPDFKEHMDIQQSIYLDIISYIRANNVEFTDPSTTILMNEKSNETK